MADGLIATQKDGKTVNYIYDVNGMRLYKTIDGVEGQSRHLIHIYNITKLPT